MPQLHLATLFRLPGTACCLRSRLSTLLFLAVSLSDDALDLDRQIPGISQRPVRAAIKNLTLAEEHLHDHFPGYPVMPASLIIEGLAQTGGILVGEAGGFAEKVVLAKIPRADFLGVACAGDQLIYEVTLKDLRSEGAVVEAKAFLDGELLVDAEIVFAHLDNSRANQIFGPKNFVFTQQLLGVLNLAKAQQRAREADEAASNNGQPHQPTGP